MRKATLFLTVAAITLWAGASAWSQPQQKQQQRQQQQPQTNTRNSGHATEQVNASGQTNANGATTNGTTNGAASNANQAGAKETKPASTQPTTPVKWMAPETKTSQPGAGTPGTSGETGTTTGAMTGTPSGVMPSEELPKETISGSREKLKATTKTQGDFNLSNKTSSAPPKAGETVTPYKDGEDQTMRIRKRPELLATPTPGDEGAADKGKPSTTASQSHEIVEYKDPEDQTTHGITKPPPPPGGPGGGDDASKNNGKLSSVKNNPLYKESGNSGTNPLYEGKDKTAAPPSGSGSGSADAEKQKRPGRPSYGNITMNSQAAPTGAGTTAPTGTKGGITGGAVADIVVGKTKAGNTSTATGSSNTLCGTTDHLRACKPGETPTVAAPSAAGTAPTAPK